MIKIINATQNDLQKMNTLWNEVCAEEGFYKPICSNEYKQKIESIPNFSYDGICLAYSDDLLVGMGIGILKNSTTGAINCILVKGEYRNQGIGEKILSFIESYFKNNGCKVSLAYGYLPSCYAWYVPRTDKHDHPCAPGIRINSNEYFFLLHHRYEISGIQDAFHLNLCDYEISDKIKDVLEENKKLGITIEIYDPKKHKGLEEFYKELNIYDFEKVIRENLALDKPYPFLVVVKDGMVKGWTGAIWNEESGRGHFDGIAILESVRGLGLGKALFSLLAKNSKDNGAKFMTFYTGQNNFARYIYMGAGFKIVQSFAIMRKELVK